MTTAAIIPNLPEKRSNRLRNRYKGALGESSHPLNYKNSYKKGVSEDFFYSHLINFFDGLKVKIIKDGVLPDNKFDRPYLPDFILLIEDINQYVVIEIDEPYVGKDGTPIHCTDSSDEFRDKHFLAHGWIVVRFAEEQIVRQPELCLCFLIESLCEYTPSREVDAIRFAKKLGFLPFSMLSKLPETATKVKKAVWDLDKIIKIPRWSREKGHKMAFTRYRNTYLPSELVARIKEEDYIPATTKAIAVS